MTGYNYIVIHNRIRKGMNHISESTNSNVINVVDLAKHLKIDSRVVRAHLRCMEIDGVGSFVKDKRKSNKLFKLKS